MARGWESKAVEDQIASAEDQKRASGLALTPAERERASKRQTLMLIRTKIVHDLENARNDRHRATLQDALRALDQQIGQIDSTR
jgi:hypothetical protein